jgi:hypothetical protein
MAEEVRMEAVKVHEIEVSLPGEVPARLDAGSDMALRVRVTCSSGCDLRGRTVKIVGQDADAAREIELTEFDGTTNAASELVMHAPMEAGEYTWAAAFPAQEVEGARHEGGSAPFTFIVNRHAISMSVWDVPSPIVAGARFKVKVGVKCSADCQLTGREVEITDADGTRVATGTLGHVPWPGTTALYWTEVDLEAPRVEGYYGLEAKFPNSGPGLSHEAASYSFGFGTARTSEHVVTVEVIDKNAQTPIANAHVLLHPYRGFTDEAGVAKVSVPKGEHELFVSAHDKQTFQTTVNVTGDVTVKTELLARVLEWWE